MKYRVSITAEATLEVPDGTSEGEFYELYHNISGVGVSVTSGDEDKVKVVGVSDEMTGFWEDKG